MARVIFDAIFIVFWAAIGAYNISILSKKIKQFQQTIVLKGDNEAKQMIIKEKKGERSEYILMYVVAMLALVENLLYSIAL